jgi:hypothetical protein
MHTGGAVGDSKRAQIKTPPSTGGGAFILNEKWIAVDPFMLKTKLDDGIATLKELALAAFAFADG